MALFPGDRLGPYEIVTPLASGGMGEVYRARDSRLHREVAIKVIASSPDPESLRRFEQEARATSALNHPNILTVYDVGTEGGHPYLVLELLEGRTLRDLLIAGERPPLRQVLVWGAQIARGLAVAHAKGIVHRDLKPENVFLTADGWIKLLDFGLAKLMPAQPGMAEIAAAATQAETTPGVLLGTVGYMAPEQVLGEVLDGRADLFALGCLLSELVRGERPFARGNPVETLAAILSAPAPPLKLGRGVVAKRAGALIQRCLEKSPAARPASAAALADELIALAEAIPTKSGPAKSGPRPAARRAAALDSVAVLPFVNEAHDPEIDYLSDGIAESLLAALTELPRLRVLARTTVERFREQTHDPIAAGRELNVRSVVTGRVRFLPGKQRGDRLTIDCEMVRVDDGVRLWGKSFDRPLADLLAVRDEIARQLAEHLRGRHSSGPQRRVAERDTANADAYRAYLKGRYFWNKWTPDSIRLSIRHYDEAIANDPLYALAWAGIADSWAVLGQTKAVAPADAFPRAKAAAERALEIDPRLGEAHASLGFVRRFYDWDWEGAESAFRRALALAPGYATAHRWCGHLYTGLGRHEEALREEHQALDLDPLSLVIHTAVGDALFYARRYDEAMTYYRRALEMDPDFLAGHSDLARALESSGRIDEAVVEYQLAIRLTGNSMADPSAGLANAFAVAGRAAEARAMLAELERARGERYVSPWALASIYARLGDRRAALDWLERAYEERDSTLVWLKVHPRFDELRSEPRFTALLTRLRLG